MSKEIVVHGKSSRQKWVAQRRAILAEIIAAEPTRRWSTREMAEAMRDHDIVGAAMPNYGHMTAHRDWLAISEELALRRRELAEQYIDTQLEITDNLLDDLLQEYQELGALRNDDDPDFQLKKMKVKKDLVQAMDRVLARQQTLIPVAVPKQVQVDSRHVDINMDTLLKQYEAAANIIEGETFEDDAED